MPGKYEKKTGALREGEMGVSVYGCKFLCTRGWKSCRFRQAEPIVLFEESPALRAFYEDALARIAKKQAESSDDAFEGFSEIQSIVNFDSPQEGVVSYAVAYWLRKYLEDDACTSSDSSKSALTGFTFEIGSSLARLIKRSRDRVLTFDEVMEVNALFASIHGVIAEASDVARPARQGQTIWSLPSDPEQLDYCDLQIHALVRVVEEIRASAEISDIAERHERTMHHVAFAMDLVGTLWRTLGTYAELAPRPETV